MLAWTALSAAKNRMQLNVDTRNERQDILSSSAQRNRADAVPVRSFSLLSDVTTDHLAELATPTQRQPLPHGSQNRNGQRLVDSNAEYGTMTEDTPVCGRTSDTVRGLTIQHIFGHFATNDRQFVWRIMMSRTLLQITTGLVAVLTIALAGMQITLGVRSPVYAAASLPNSPILDSNLRFFGGMGLGLGFILLAIVPSIQRRATLFRAVWLCAFLGGIGRAISIAIVGPPSTAMIWFTVIELPCVPFFIWWQHRVAAASCAHEDSDRSKPTHRSS